MDYKTFSGEMDKKIKIMEYKELYKLNMELLRHIPENRRTMVVESIVSGDDGYNYKNENLVKSEFDRIIILCESIANGKKTIKGTLCYGDYGYDYDEECDYQDNDGVENDLEDALEIANWMLMNREYQYAKDIYNKLAELTIRIDYDEDFDYLEDQNELTFDELVYEMNFGIDIHKVAVKTLYVEYMSAHKNNRVSAWNNHYAWNLKGRIRIEEIELIGPEPLEELEDFLAEWILLLKNKSGNQIAELLEDAFFYLEGNESIETYAKELPDKFPGFYLHWFEYLLEHKVYRKIIDEAKAAFKEITRISRERYVVANITYIASEKLKDYKMMWLSSEIMFESEPSVKTFLRLKTLPIVEPLCNEIIITPMDISSLMIDEKQQMAIMIFNRQWEEVLAKLKRNKKSLGWSGEWKEIAVPLLLIILLDVEKITPLVAYLLKEIGKKLNYSMQLDDVNFFEYYKLWRSSINVTVEERKEIYFYCEKQIDNRVRGIVSNRYRNAYRRAAEVSQLLSEIGYNIGITQSVNEIILKHQLEFPRHRAFKGEYENLKCLQDD